MSPDRSPDGELRRLTGAVWLWPHHPDASLVRASVGVVAGDGGSLIVDAGQSPTQAGQVIAAMERQGLPPARMLTYTHHHWDHTWGACAWGVPVVAHDRCAELLAVEAEKPWSQGFLRTEMERNRRLAPSYRARAKAVPDFAALRFVPPEQTFTDRLALEVAGVRVELEHVGGQHAPDSTVVRLPDEKVLFLGDCYYPPPYHLRDPDDQPDLAMVAGLVGDDYDWYVESHDRPRRRDEARAALQAAGS